MIIPAIHSKGRFVFSEPFNSLIKATQEFTVVSIRTLKEIEESGEKPFDTIYKSVNMTEAQFKDDLHKEVPIIVFTTDGGEYFYVPASKLLSEPITTDIPYREQTLAVNLGNLPTTIDLTVVKTLIQDAVYNNLSITPRVKVIPTSAITVVTKARHDTFMTLMKNKSTVDQSYKTKYYELLARHKKQQVLIGHVEDAVKNGMCNN
jgi:hypothetical protein